MTTASIGTNLSNLMAGNAYYKNKKHSIVCFFMKIT